MRATPWAALALAVVAAALPADRVEAQDGRPPAPVVVARAEQRELRTTQQFVGTVRPTRMSMLGAEVEGLVVEVLADEGDHVAKGVPMLRLRTAPVQADLDGAQAELARREAVLAELVAGPRAEDVAASRADVAEARAEVTYRRWKLESTEQLRDQGRSSAEELELARAESEKAAARLAQMEAVLARMEAGTRKEQLDAARAEVAAQRAVVSRLADELERHVLRAPYTGFVAERHVQEGAWLGTGDTAFRFVELEPVEIDVPVPEDRVALLRPGQTARVAVGALGRSDFEGEIVEIVPVGDARTRTFPVRVRVENEVIDDVPRLLAGMTARVTLPVGEVASALVVPKDALVIGARGTIVQVVTPTEGESGQGTTAPVTVEVGIALNGLIQIEGPIPPGALVVVKGNERLMPGQAVAFSAPSDTASDGEQE